MRQLEGCEDCACADKPPHSVEQGDAPDVPPSVPVPAGPDRMIVTVFDRAASAHPQLKASSAV
jgi:hypothetical protein